MRKIFAFVIASIVSPMAACGGGSGGYDTELLGIYTMTTWTENDAGCDAEGPSILETETNKAIFVEIGSFLGVSYMQAVKCVDTADCAMQADGETIFLDAFAFENDGSDSGGWTGTTVAAGGIDMCSGSVSDYVMTGPTPDTLRIESRTRDARPFPKDSEGFCNTDDAKVAAEGQPCVRFEVITATFAQEL
jgi:hypothetical protein